MRVIEERDRFNAITQAQSIPACDRDQAQGLESLSGSRFSSEVWSLKVGIAKSCQKRQSRPHHLA
jgi:hypothetical protein